MSVTPLTDHKSLLALEKNEYLDLNSTLNIFMVQAAYRTTKLNKTLIVRAT